MVNRVIMGRLRF